MTKLAPAIKKETINILIYTAIGVALMFLAFFVLSLIYPEDVPFDYTVILGGIAGGAIAVLNFFLMSLTVQKITSTEDDDTAKRIMKLSYSRRMFLQFAWILVSVFVPCFQVIAGIAPLLFPGIGIKVRGVLSFKLGYNKN